MQEFFTQGIRYKPPSREWLADVFPDGIYLKIKYNFDAFFAEYNMIKSVFDENNYWAEDRILNMIVLTKDKWSFHAYPKSFYIMRLTAYATATWMIEKIYQIAE